MICKRYNGEPNIQPHKKKVSTAMTLGQIVAKDSNGFLIPAVAATAAADCVGVIQETIASTDSDYTSTRDVLVDCFRKGNRGDLWDLEVETGTPAQTHEGETHDLTAAGKADLTATSTNIYRVERFVSTTAPVKVSFL
jgi:hypothetical protein